MALSVAGGTGADDPLRIADITRFLRVGISEGTILAEIQARGVSEPVDATGEAALREAGATDKLVDAVRSAAPKAPAEPPPPEVPQAPRATGATRSRQGPVFGVSTRLVRLPVSVTDKNGRPVTDLRQAEFRVMEEGRPQEITFFSGERKPLRIAVALDVSGSMEDKIDEVGDALKHFIDLLEPDDEVLVMTFSDRPRLIQDFTSDRRRLGRVLDALRPAGGTALYDAVIEATERVAAAPAESKAVVLITDGKDTVSTTSFQEAREAARRSEVPVYSIGIGHEAGFAGLLGRLGVILPGSHGGGGGAHGGSGESDFDPRPLLELADETGARAEILKGLEHHHTGKVDRIKDAAESIALTLRYRYLLAYDPAVTGGRSGWRKIRVDVDRPGVQVRARKGYYSGPQP